MSTSTSLARPEPSPPPATAPRVQAPRHQAIDSTELLRGNRTVTISHNGEVYRLQTTRQGKLILTK